MKKRQLSILIVGVLMAFGVSDSFGQSKSKVPGYMGKRFSFGYKFHAMPGYGKNPTVNEEYDPSKDGENASFFLKLNYFHEGFIEMVLGKRTSLVAKGVFTKGQFSPYISHSSFEETSVHTGASNWGKFNAAGGALSYRLYGKHLAPLSTYLGVSVGWQQVSTEQYDFVEYDYYEPKSRSIKPATGGTVYFGIEYGVNHILFDRMILNLSIESNLFVSSLLNYDLIYDYSSTEYMNQSELQDEIVAGALYRLQRQQILSFGIGIGFLP